MARDGSKAGEACGMAGFERAEFGHFDEERESGDLSESRDARQNGEAFGEVWTASIKAFICVSMAAI